MHPLLNIAVKAACQAGKIIARHLDDRDTLTVHQKGPNDWVTSVDSAAEAEIIHIIRKVYPHHSILGEETGLHPGDDTQWIIDPLDGTLSYLHGFPQFAVSIAVQHKGQIEHGVVYDPLSQDLYTASRGAGARLNERRIRVSTLHSLEDSLIGCAFPYHARTEHFDRQFKILKKVFTTCADVRRTGSAALNLAYIAAGRLDGCWETGLKAWDMAAGVLLVREAGGFVSDFNGQNEFLTSGNLIAGTRRVQSELLTIIQTHTNDSSSISL